MVLAEHLVKCGGHQQEDDQPCAVGADLEAGRSHFLLALEPHHDDGFAGSARSVAFDQFEGVEFGGIVADQHGVEGVVAKSMKGKKRSAYLA